MRKEVALRLCERSADEDLVRATAASRSPIRSPVRVAPAVELPRSRSVSPNPVPIAPNTEELVRLLVETEMDAHQAAIQVAALQEALKVFREVRTSTNIELCSAKTALYNKFYASREHSR